MKNVKKMCLGLVSVLMIGCLGSCQKNTNAIVSVAEKSIVVKSLAEGTTSLNTVKTFTYAIKNGDSTYNDLTIASSYKDGGDCSDAITCVLDTVAKQVTITCLKPFDKQIIVNLSCKIDSKIKTSVTVDYRKKLSNITCNDFGTTDLIAISDYSKVPDFLALVKNVYSIGSLDYNGTVVATLNKTYTWADTTLDNELHGHTVACGGWEAYKSAYSLVDGYLHSDTISLEDLTLNNLIEMLAFIKSKNSNASNSNAVKKCHFVSTVTMSDGVFSKTFKVAWIDTWSVETPTTMTTSVSGIEF